MPTLPRPPAGCVSSTGVLIHTQPREEDDHILLRSHRFEKAGFVRRQGEPSLESRNAFNESREKRRVDHDLKRTVKLGDTENRNGFNAIVGAQYDGGEKDDFVPRGTRFLRADVGEMREVEIAARTREPDFRFFRIENPDDARLQHRTKVLLDAGLKDGQKKRTSSELGYGRRDLKSFGAADAFDAADYGGTLWVADLERAQSSAGALRESSRGVGGGGVALGNSAAIQRSQEDVDVDIPFFMKQGPRDVWDVGRVDPDAVRRRALASQRAPNRIFDTTSEPVILHSVPDPVQREVRETRDILRARPPRPADRPASFTAHASMLAMQRAQKEAQAERDLVKWLS
jgi:hypothetical protein